MDLDYQRSVASKTYKVTFHCDHASHMTQGPTAIAALTCDKPHHRGAITEVLYEYNRYTSWPDGSYAMYLQPDYESFLTWHPTP